MGSGEPLDWSHFPPVLQSSLASPLFCCQTCVQAQRAKPGASKVIFFSPSIFSLSAQTLLFFLLSRQTTQFSPEAGGLIWSSWHHYLGVIPLSGSQFWLRGVSTSQVRKAGTAAAHAVQSGGGLSVWPPPHLAKPHQIAALRHPWGEEVEMGHCIGGALRNACCFLKIRKGKSIIGARVPLPTSSQQCVIVPKQMQWQWCWRELRLLLLLSPSFWKIPLPAWGPGQGHGAHTTGRAAPP